MTKDIINAANSAGVKQFIPSEYGFDTSNTKIRDALPPYSLRFGIQEILNSSGMQWKAIYAGIVLEDEIKEDGVLGLDLLWGSVSIFSGSENTRVPFSTFDTISRAVVEAVLHPEDTRNEQHVCSFETTPNEVIELIEKHLDRKLDRYQYDTTGAKREATQRMKLGYFDGGVSLMSKVATWDPNIDAWANWSDSKDVDRSNWEEKVTQVVDKARAGGIGESGCGC